MRLIHDTSWRHRGISLLWSPRALFEIAPAEEVMSIRQFFALAHAWPDDLPSGAGNTLVVAGVEGCLDALAPADAEAWLGRELRSRMMSFQDEYEGQAGLVLWMPAGKQRITMKPATEEYLWRCAPQFGQHDLPIGRILWGGAEGDAGRILDPDERSQDFDGPAWMGLYHPRIS
jgi:hypothetical protein